MIEKNKVNKGLGATLLILILGFGIVILLQLSSIFLGPSKKACTKRVCLAKYLEGPPAFNDQELKDYIKARYIEETSGPLNPSGVTEMDPHLEKILEIIKTTFKNKRDGSFVVLGAGDGEYQDVTLSLETELGWTGLLVEPHKELYAKLKAKGRKATLSKNCVSPFTYPSMVKFGHKKISPGDSDKDKIEKYRNNKISQLWGDDTDLVTDSYQCIPLENLIYGAGIDKQIDLLVLDMTGTDLDVLINVRLENLPPIEMIMVRSSGTNISSDIGSFFLENNMVIFKALGRKAEDVVYLLKKFKNEDEI